MSMSTEARLAPLRPRERRVWLPSQEMFVVVDEDTREVVPVLPMDWNLREALIVHNTVDRGSPGMSGLNYLAGPGRMLITATWGCLHDGWNSCRQAGKKTNRGSIWREVVKFANVCNFNYKPFKPGAWGIEKQQTLVRLTHFLSVDDERFREAVLQQLALHPQGRFGSIAAPDWDAWWEYLAGLPSCMRSPTVLKFSRWMSVLQCWN